MKLALKVDVPTLRGALTGVPRLMKALGRHEAQASFLFALGPDRTHRRIGPLPLPAPRIGRRAAAVLRSVRDAGFETGLQSWDPVAWVARVEQADAAWTEAQLARAAQCYGELFGEAPRLHGAAGWRLNAHALRLTQRLGFAFCSDCRGTHPFVPVQKGEIVLCPQLPTTLPTLDELIGRDGITADNVHERLLDLTAVAPAQGHVYSLRAELEGDRFLPVLERLLEAWRGQGYELVCLRALFDTLDAARLPRHRLLWGEVPGRTGRLLVQGPEFLAVTQ